MMKRPIIYSVTENGEKTPIFSQGDYDVFVGSLDDSRLPQYVLINRTTNVVEFTTEVTGVYKEWLNHFAPTERVGRPEGQMSLSLAN